MLSPEGKKIPTRGRGAARRKQEEALLPVDNTGLDIDDHITCSEEYFDYAMIN